VSGPAPAAPPVLLVGDVEDGGDGGGAARLLPAAVLTDPPPEGRVVDLGALHRPRVRPGIAVVLGRPVGPDATPAAAYLAVAAAFLCIRLTADGGDGALLLGEGLLPDPSEGALRLDLDGDRLVDVPVELPGVLPGRLAALAAAGPELIAGQLVAVLSVVSGPARPGALLLTGPGGRSLLAQLVDAAAEGRTDR
jgi:hypothetical protein